MIYKMKADEEISTSIFSTSLTMEKDPTEPYELEELLQKCKNKKHPGVDKITIEMVKYASTDVKIRFLNLLNHCWQRQYIPESWKEARIIPIFKKGDRSKCENYRRISLLNEGYKIYEKI
jgi:hypothetical protein